MDSLFALITSGLVGGFIGTFIGGFSKFFWERWLPDRLTWKREQSVRQRELLATHRDPAVRAINELQGRLWVILDSKAANYHYVKRLGNDQYYIDSTAFFIAQYFAWSEMMRSQIAALDYNELSQRLEMVSEEFAHGGPGFQLFALEQREIGERLMESRISDSDAHFRYSGFNDLLNSKNPPESLLILRKRAKYFLDNYEKEVVRAGKIQNALVDLLDFVDPKNRWVRTERRNKFPYLKPLEKKPKSRRSAPKTVSLDKP